MTDLAFNKALQSIWELIGLGNKYIDDTAPWALAKDESQKDRLGTIMYNLLDSLRLVGILIAPVMPETAGKILEILGCDPEDLTLADKDRWGGLKPGTAIAKAKPLFPRIEIE
jgi:methionyl-tRNA synthetase